MMRSKGKGSGPEVVSAQSGCGPCSFKRRPGSRNAVRREISRTCLKFYISDSSRRLAQMVGRAGNISADGGEHSPGPDIEPRTAPHPNSHRPNCKERFPLGVRVAMADPRAASSHKHMAGERGVTFHARLSQ